MSYIGRQPTAAALTASDITDGIVSNAKLAQDIISADTALGATPADTDEFLVSDAGTLKRMDYSYIKAANTPAFLVVGDNTTNQTISTATVTKVTNLTESFDTDSAFDATTNFRFTVPAGEDGKYFFYASTRINTATDIGSVECTIFKGGTGGTEIGKSMGSHWYFDTKTVVSIVDLSAADYIEMFIYHNLGSDADISGSPGHTFFGGYKLII